MRVRLVPLIVAFLGLLSVGSLLGWQFDLYHVVVGIPSLVVMVLSTYWWQKRNQLAEEFTEEEFDESLGHLILQGVGYTLIALAIFSSSFWLGSKTQVYAFFYDVDRVPMTEKLETLKKAKAWSSIVAETNKRLGKQASAKWKKELFQYNYEAFIEQGQELRDSYLGGDRSKLRIALGKFQEAKKIAEASGLDCQLAEAEIRVTQEKINTILAKTPTKLPHGAKMAIDKIDISSGLVDVYIHVEDKEGRPIKKLKEKDFEVKVNGRPVSSFRVMNFSKSPELLNACLLFDISGSTGKSALGSTILPIDGAKEGGRHFVNLLSKHDWLELIVFNEEVHRLISWTQDRTATLSALKQLQAQGDTALYDGLWLAVEDFSSCSGRKSIVLFTDGRDTASSHQLPETLGKIKENKIPVYIVGLRSKDLDRNTLVKIAAESGGLYLEAAISSQLKDVYTQVAGKIKNQYRLTFIFPQSADSHGDILWIQIGSGQNAIQIVQPY